MPVNCADFLKKVQTKKAIFGLVGKGTQWKFYIDSEIGPLLKGDKVKDDMQIVTGKAEWKSNKLNLVVDGVKDDAKKALKAAYTAEKIKWEDTAISIKGCGEDDEPGKGNGTGSPTPQQNTGAAAARPLTELQLHKIKVLNPRGVESGVFNVPRLLTDAQIAVLLKTLPPGTQARRVDASAITLDTPVNGTATAAPKQQSPAQQAPVQQAPVQQVRPQQGPARPEKEEPEKPAPQRPGSAAPHAYQQVKERLTKLSAELKLLKSSSPKMEEVIAVSQKDPFKAQRMLDELEKEIARQGQKDPLLRAAAQLRMDWEKATREMELTNPVFTSTRDAVLKAIEEKKPKEALQALVKLQQDLKAPRAMQLISKKIFAANNSILDFERFGQKLANELAKELDMPAEAVLRLIKEANNNLLHAADKLRPEGFELTEDAALINQCSINPLAPKESRPALSVEEARAMQAYSLSYGIDANGKKDATQQAPYKNLNGPLWADQKPAPPHDKTYEDLRKAFAKAKPFAKPIPVVRGMNFDDQAVLDKYLQPYKDAVGKETLIPLKGFISSSTTGIQPNFAGNIVLNIQAKLGLDVLPYTDSPQEKEILLNHNTMVQVIAVRQDGKRWHLDLVQVLPKKSSYDPSAK